MLALKFTEQGAYDPFCSPTSSSAQSGARSSLQATIPCRGTAGTREKRTPQLHPLPRRRSPLHRNSRPRTSSSTASSSGGICPPKSGASVAPFEGPEHRSV